MQRFAFSNSGERVDASEAPQHLDHLCPECRGIVRVRRGEERAPHFFHRNEGTSCHLRLKDGIHQAVQSFLLNALGPTACTCECHFPSISRIADVAYHPQNVVFEVQVSPMKAEEAMERTLDYWSVGWHVIWLLHATTFGTLRSSSFEKILMGIPHYFTDIGYRAGTIWDEMSAPRGEKRCWYALPPQRQIIHPLSVEILRPPPTSFPSSGFPSTASQWMQMRRSLWSCRFGSDFLSSEIHESKKPFPTGWWRKKAKIMGHLFWLRSIG